MAKIVENGVAKNGYQRFAVILDCDNLDCSRHVELEPVDIYGIKLVQTFPTVKWVKRAVFKCPRCKTQTFVDYDSLPPKLKDRVDSDYFDFR